MLTDTLKTLNSLLENIDTAKFYEDLCKDEKTLENEISDLENGQVVWMGLGMSLEQIDAKIKLRKVALNKIKAWKELLK